MPDSSTDKETTKRQSLLKQEEKDNWLWTEFVTELLLSNASNNSLGEFVKVVYLWKHVNNITKISQFDSEEYGFPFSEDDLKRLGGVNYTGAYKELRDGGRYHWGVDLALSGDNCANPAAIHAIHDGTVTSAGDGWGSAENSVSIDHGDGTFSRYLHMDKLTVSRGQQVKRGDVVGYEGGYSGYATHLHIEFGHGEPESTQHSDTNPMTLWKHTGEWACGSGEHIDK